MTPSPPFHTLLEQSHRQMDGPVAANKGVLSCPEC